MGKGKGLGFLFFATLGAITGYASYMANKDEFSDETKDRFDTVLNKARNVGTDIRRTYTSIGDKEEFIENSKDLGTSAMKMFEKAGDLIASASTDMLSSTKTRVAKAMDNIGAYNSSKKSKASKVAKTAKTTKTKKAKKK